MQKVLSFKPLQYVHCVDDFTPLRHAALVHSLLSGEPVSRGWIGEFVLRLSPIFVYRSLLPLPKDYMHDTRSSEEVVLFRLEKIQTTF